MLKLSLYRGLRGSNVLRMIEVSIPSLSKLSIAVLRYMKSGRQLSGQGGYSLRIASWDVTEPRRAVTT